VLSGSNMEAFRHDTAIHQQRVQSEHMQKDQARGSEQSYVALLQPGGQTPRD